MFYSISLTRHSLSRIHKMNTQNDGNKAAPGAEKAIEVRNSTHAVFSRLSTNPAALRAMIQNSEKREKVLKMAMEARKALCAKEDSARKKKATFTDVDFDYKSLVNWAINVCQMASNEHLPTMTTSGEEMKIVEPDFLADYPETLWNGDRTSTARKRRKM